MSEPELLDRACATLTGYFELGNQVLEAPGASFVRNAQHPRIYDANHVCAPRASTPDQLDALLRAVEEEFAELGHRQFKCDLGTPPALEARLVLEDYVVSSEVQLLLEGDLQAQCPPLRFWIARAEGSDCAFFSSWPGTNGIGKVEDLFTLPEFRGRGIGTALIAHAVLDARERGAGPVLIGALTDDAPKHMYAGLGFRPLCVMREYLKLC